MPDGGGGRLRDEGLPGGEGGGGRLRNEGVFDGRGGLEGEDDCLVRGTASTGLFVSLEDIANLRLL